MDMRHVDPRSLAMRLSRNQDSGIGTTRPTELPDRQPFEPEVECPVCVVSIGNEAHVVACRWIQAGECVLRIKGRIQKTPTRYSLQVEDGCHVVAPAGLKPDTAPVRYRWRFLNHHCFPNTRLVGRDMVALKLIPAGEEITFNYNTTEYDMAYPFRCWCGVPGCFGKIAGFRHLSVAERERLRLVLAPHLLRIIPKSTSALPADVEDR